MIVYEMCVLFFKMAADLRTWDASCEDLFCHSILGHLVCRNLRLYHDNPHVWEEITKFINACFGKAFSVRWVMRQWKRTRRNYQSLMGVRTMALRCNDSHVTSLDRLSDDPPL